MAMALLCSGQFVVVLDASIVAVALPAIRTDLGMQPEQLTQVISFYALAFGGLLILGGRLADRWGRRLTFGLGMAGFAVASLAAGVAQVPAALLTARSGQGASAAFVSPAALALLTTAFAGASRTRALAMWGAVSAAGGASGLVVGGLLTDVVGWPWVFFVNVPVCVAAVLAAPRVLAETRPESVRRLDLTGTVLLVSAMAALLHGLGGIAEGRSNWGGLVSLLLGGAGMAAFIVVEARAAHPLIDMGVVRIRSVMGGNLAAASLAAVIAAQSYFGSLYLQGTLGFSALQTGLAVLPVTLLAFAGSAAGGRLVDHIGVRATTVAGLLTAGAGLALLSGISAQASYTTAVLPGFLVFGLGLGAAFVSATMAATSDLPTGTEGLASGLVNTSQQLGFAVGLAALAGLVSTVGPNGGGGMPGYRLAFGAAAAMALVGAVLAAAVLPRRARAVMPVGAAMPDPHATTCPATPVDSEGACP